MFPSQFGAGKKGDDILFTWRGEGGGLWNHKMMKKADDYEGK